MKPKLNSYWQTKSTVRLYLLALHRALFMRRPVYGSLLFHNMRVTLPHLARNRSAIYETLYRTDTRSRLAISG